MYILITFIAIIILAAFITIDNDLRLLKQTQFHSVIEHSRFMRVIDIIFNTYFEWRFWKLVALCIRPVLRLMKVAPEHGRKQPSSNKFKSYRDSSTIYKAAPGELNSLMPWSTYAYMTDKDLYAIYSYLKSIKPVYNPVVKFTRQSIEKLKTSDQTE